MKKNNKYDFIIYGCLFLAIILIVVGSWDYIISIKEEGLKFNNSEVEKNDNKASEDIEEPLDGNTGATEPADLVAADKKALVQKYLDSILDQIITDELISYEMIKSWDTYEVLDVTYEREIVDKYYAYDVNLKINNPKAELPVPKNKELSTKKYVVISLDITIIYSSARNGYIVKNIDIPTENSR